MMSDHRPLKQIGSGNTWLGFGRLIHQTAWGVWWRSRERLKDRGSANSPPRQSDYLSRGMSAARQPNRSREFRT